MLTTETLAAWSIASGKEARAERIGNGQPFSLPELDAYEAGCRVGFRVAVALLRLHGYLKTEDTHALR